MSLSRPITALSLLAASALVLSACASGAAPAETDPGESAPPAAETDYYPVTVTDMAGNEVTIDSVESVGITDNRFFQLAANWDLAVTVAPRQLMSPNNPLKDVDSILDVGTHGEPDLETFVAADPDVIINGYRFSAETGEAVHAAAPDAAFVDMTGPEDQSADEYVVESLTLMGEIFNKNDEADALIEEFHDALDAAKGAYNPEDTVLGLLTSGGEINFSNPIDGRGASTFFGLLDLTPALDVTGSSEHLGDSVSLEALSETNADILLVLDREAAVASGTGEVSPARDLITTSPSLANLPAVQNDAIYVMPDDYYLTEDVFAYISVLNGLIEVFEAE